MLGKTNNKHTVTCSMLITLTCRTCCTCRARHLWQPVQTSCKLWVNKTCTSNIQTFFSLLTVLINIRTIVTAWPKVCRHLNVWCYAEGFQSPEHQWGPALMLVIMSSQRRWQLNSKTQSHSVYCQRRKEPRKYSHLTSWHPRCVDFFVNRWLPLIAYQSSFPFVYLLDDKLKIHCWSLTKHTDAWSQWREDRQHKRAS